MQSSAFKPVKLICGIIASDKDVFRAGEKYLISLYGEIEESSDAFPFTFTDYYEKEMGPDLYRKFIGFSRLIAPEALSTIKVRTNRMEREIGAEFKSGNRIINIDPGYLSAAALIMATTKDFAHRVPLNDGIYAHLELLFGRREVKLLSWTYPDFKQAGYQKFLMQARENYLDRIRADNRI